MTEQQLKGMNPREKRDFLETHADTIEEGEFFKSFSQDDLLATQANLADVSVIKDRKEQELQEIKAKFKIELDKLKKEFKESLKNLIMQGEYVHGKQYLFADQVNGMMEYYDEHGILIRSRRLKPEERQLSVLSINKASNQ